MTSRQAAISNDTERIDLSEVLFRSVEPGVILVHQDQTISALNPRAERLLKLDAVDLVGQMIGKLPPPLHRTLIDTLESKRPVVDRSVILPGDGEGNRLILRVSTYFLPSGNGAPPSVMLALHDLSAARELEVKTERLQRLASLGILSAGVAHEIKNALVAIKSFAELLQEKNQDLEMVQLVVQEANRINSLVGQLMRLAVPVKTVHDDASAHESIHNALRLVKHQLKNRSIELNVGLEATTDRVRGDPKQLEQVLINLLLNAVEAMGETGTLTVSTRNTVATARSSKFEPNAPSHHLQILVKDTGSGIPKHLHDSLFKPFFTTKPGGTGLGLAITRRIVNTMGGEINLISAPEVGTTFVITVPAVDSDPIDKE